MINLFKKHRKSLLFIGIISLCFFTQLAFSISVGDVNSDSTVNIIDALLTAQYSSGYVLTNFNAAYADVNEDSQVNIVDGLLIVQYAAGIITSLPSKGLSPRPTPSPTPVPTPTATGVTGEGTWVPYLPPQASVAVSMNFGLTANVQITFPDAGYRVVSEGTKIILPGSDSQYYMYYRIEGVKIERWTGVSAAVQTKVNFTYYLLYGLRLTTFDFYVEYEGNQVLLGSSRWSLNPPTTPASTPTQTPY